MSMSGASATCERCSTNIVARDAGLLGLALCTDCLPEFEQELRRWRDATAGAGADYVTAVVAARLRAATCAAELG
jgi:hypothetical protein